MLTYTTRLRSKGTLSVTLMLFLALFTFTAEQARAQTPVTQIENAAGDSVFVSFEDGALLGLGNYLTGDIPTSGVGVRMMWYPAKAAFRAGNVEGTQWDDANIGNSSTAMGYNTTASGSGSMAMGGNTTANGDYSTAMGTSTTASGAGSTAMGYSTTASGFRSMTMGYSTTASGSYSVAMGVNTTAATSTSLSIGAYNSANTTDDGTLFVVGNGTSTAPSDALVLYDTGDMTIAGTLTESSDRRLKKDITPLENGILRKLGTITPSHYQFKNQQTHPAGPQIGLIAQEVQQQFPELVSEASNGYLSVSYSKFTAVLLKGMQEQQEKIEQLEEKVDRIDNLRAEIANLKDQNQQAGMPWPTTAIALTLLIGAGLVWKRNSTKNG